MGRVCVLLALPMMVVSAGCGRFGFEPLSFDREERPSVAGDENDASGSTSLDAGGSDAEGGEDAAGAHPAADADAATVTEDGGGVIGPGSPNDGGAPKPNVDAGAPDTSLPPTTLEPLPTNIDCETGFTGLVACDNFSGSASGVSVSTVAYGNGARAITNDYFTGSVTQESTGAHVEAGFNSLTNGNVYLRFSLFVPGGFEIRGINLASLGDLSSGTEFGLDLNLVRGGELEIKTSGDGAVRNGGSYLLPRNRWLCLLLKIEGIDNSTGSARLLVDNQEIIAATNVDTEPPSGITGASAGIDWSFFQQGPAQVHVDNFVVTRDHPSDCP